ncbi:MAG TPA: thioredoxin family protein [Methylomirabilota bacterium]|nr:thioredoxin family protein [Methylomirabilota bacterium]
MTIRQLTRRGFLTRTAAGALLAGTASSALFSTRPAWAATAKVGEPAPAFTVNASKGSPVSLSAYKGKIVVLEWTNHDCPYVRKHYDSGNMQGLQRDATGQGVVWLTVISSVEGTQGHVTPSQADELTTSRKAAPTAVLLDTKGATGKAYGATNTPHMYVVDKAGILVYAGAIDDRPTSRRADVQGANNYVRAALDAVAAGQPVKTPVTRAYGCTVKYS